MRQALQLDLQKLAAGDEATLVSLAEYLRPRIRMYISAYAQEADVLDIIEEVLLMVLRNPERLAALETEDQILNYCLKAARNAVVHSARPKREKSTSELSESESGQSMYDEVMRQETLHALTEAMSKLPDQYREAIFLSVEGYTHEEISQMLQVPRGTVAVRLYRARKLLADALKAEGFLP